MGGEKPRTAKKEEPEEFNPLDDLQELSFRIKQ
jgi:hypothetical protein